SVTRIYFEQIAKLQNEDVGKWMRALETPDRADHAARFISDQDPVWNSTLRTTIAPTIFQSGFRENVVPSDAKATLNIRLLPGDPVDPLVAKLKTLVDDPEVQFEVEHSARGAAPSSSLDSDFYRTIEIVANKEFPGSITVPMMSTGATDSAPLRLRSVQAYGVLPFPLSEEDLKRMHGDNERIPVASFQKGIDFLYQIVWSFAVSK
ncbi:MAG: M20/M25/M40 family metallo-hydrolase, partial [Candidatus Acidiferrales bacterium]